jgi:hypothetical protein
MIVGTAAISIMAKLRWCASWRALMEEKAPHAGTTPIRGEMPDYRRRSSSTKSNLLTMTLRACS